jgi:ABC-type dipeptide/oligopeptide/nickel transport system permease subunit
MIGNVPSLLGPGEGASASSAGLAEGGEVGPVRSGWRLALREFAGNRLAVAGVAILVFFILFSFAGPSVYHTNQLLVNNLDTFAPPGAGHPLGTDNQGFDELGRLMLGGQAAVEIGLFTALLATGIGMLWGAVAGLAGGLADALMMRVVDMMLSIPFLFAILILASRYSSSAVTLVLVLAVFSWLVPARLVRGEVLTLRVRDFVSAARTAGASRRRIVASHLIPNSLSVIVVNVTFQVADAIGALAVLGFLGFGLQYPHTDWGDQLSNGVGYLQDGYWWLVYPVGACIVAVIVACNFVGDALRDSLDVRLRRR